MLAPDALGAAARSRHVLDIGFGTGLNFLAHWHAWSLDPGSPGPFHYSAIDASPVSADHLLRAARPFAALVPLAEALAPHWFGLVPGTHRIELHGGRVLLNLHIGQAEAVLPTLDAEVDAVFLHHPGYVDTACWPVQLIKAVGKLCRWGTRLAAQTDTPALRSALVTAGFDIRPPQEPTGTSGGTLRASYAPRWAPATAVRSPLDLPTQVTVIGGGLAGSAVAYSLAQRGWSVDVLDTGAEPAAGASGLPAGIVAPHVSPDDAPLSRLSRAGVRLTLQRAATLLRSGTDWGLSGVLEHRVEARRGLPTADGWQTWGKDWSRPASQEQQASCGLQGSDCLWHPHAGWIRPAPLVKAQLRHPRIRWHGGAAVERLQQTDSGWAVLGPSGEPWACSPWVVLATAWNTRRLLEPLSPRGLPLNPLRGQVTWGPLDALTEAARAGLPPFPVNGHGALVHGVQGPDGRPAWVVGSTFERAVPEPVVRAEDRAANLLKLQGLLPNTAALLAPEFERGQDWAGVRCTLPDRLPAVGPVDHEALPGLAVCTGLGARGLTLSVLCGEWLAARLHGEPWPTERKLAESLNAARFSARPPTL